MASISIFNPAGFDPAMVLPPELRRYGDSARYFLHTIIVRGQVASRADAEGFVRLKSAILRRYFPGDDHYKMVRDCLIAGESIVCDCDYVKGQKSYGYKLGRHLTNMRHHKVEVTNRLLIKKIQGRRLEWVKTPEPVHRHLLKNLGELEIDYTAALESLLGGEYEPSDETAIQLIRDRQFFFGVCDYGRVHTNLTNLKSSMRHFLTHRGRSLVNLDIRNSQPLFFGVLLTEMFRSKPMPKDVRLYLDLVQGGQFYDYLMGAVEVSAEGRSRFKQEFFGKVFFCANDPVKDSARLFGEQFPNVYTAIRSMKADSYCALAHRLQRAESALMIGHVANRLMIEMPDVFVATIHDSAVTTVEDADEVKAIMLAEFRKIDLNPTINLHVLSCQ